MWGGSSEADLPALFRGYFRKPKVKVFIGRLLSPSIRKFDLEFIPSGLSAEGAAIAIGPEKYVTVLATRSTKVWAAKHLKNTRLTGASIAR